MSNSAAPDPARAPVLAPDPSNRYVRQPNGRITPMSPHMGIWRWHITMWASILFRATIIAASFGVLFVLGWLGATAFGPQSFADFGTVAASPFGLFIGMGLTLVLFSFLLNGARHLLNDMAIGLKLKPADLMSWVAVVGPVVLTALAWIALFASGRVGL